MNSTPPDSVLWGITTGGRRFRPSDWADRLAGLTAVFGLSGRIAYSSLVRPMTIAGVRAVIVGGALASLEPRLYHFLLQFAVDNELQRVDVPGALADPGILVPPSVSGNDGRARS